VAVLRGLRASVGSDELFTATCPKAVRVA